MGFWDKLFGRPLEHEAGNDPRITDVPPGNDPQSLAAQPPSADSVPGTLDSDADSLTERIRRTPPRPMPGFSPPEQAVRSATVANRHEPVNALHMDSSVPVPDAVAPTSAAESSAFLPDTGGYPTDDDRLHLANVVSMLADAGITPKRDISMTDVITGCQTGLPGFRLRPLTTMMQLVDADGFLLFNHVNFDVEQSSRTTVDELTRYAEVLARDAGSADSFAIRAVPDPGSTLHGSLRITHGNDVTDLDYDLDPDFGDAVAEQALTQAVSTPGRRAYSILTDAQGERLTAWVVRTAPGVFFETLAAENPITTS